ncbi:site-2 protease family protein [Acidipila sp. EB88]|uniref:site-2 protease family protein n=1 Tax=Acidipila sp. EB88 TaxID=2305226 RepID=UPI000F5F473D|nr:site-2 protease family protein [Acidipila sp. EB88]RRA47576.1 site-2 protease family protein [Acidipila sp. EB88]
MSQQEIVLKIFEFVLLLFSLSLHEAAHAWTASRLGDQTARMLGRVTLNPVKHIDPVGTVLLPLAMLFLGPYGGRFLIGWARPTPVNTRNFKHYKRDDVLTTLAGPVSNLLISLVCVVALIVLAKTSPVAQELVRGLAFGGFDPSQMEAAPALFPSVLLLYMALTLNLFLAFFNLLPLPPLDGSHLIRHLLPTNLLQIYDRLGIISLLLMFVFGGRLVNLFVGPALALVNRILVSV